MSNFFLRPDHLHSPDKVLSVSTEEGLVVGAPVAASANVGTLRLRSSGNPLAARDLDILHLTGGNPVGYANSDNGAGAGSAVVWKEAADTATQYRGYIDTIYLVRTEFPVVRNANDNQPSTPRELASGNLGILVAQGQAGAQARFHSIDPDGTVGVANIAQICFDDYKADFVVLPSGRLVAVLAAFASVFALETYYSDDNGATWTLLGRSELSPLGNPAADLNLEYVDDMLIVTQGDPAGVESVHVYLSRDGGASFTEVDTAAARFGCKTCVTKSGVILVASRNNTTHQVIVSRLIPGGGLEAGSVATTASCRSTIGGASGIVCRDDGTIWVWGCNPGVDDIAFDISVSLDEGVTWEDPAGSQYVFDTDFVATVSGYESFSVGTWRGKVVMAAYTEGSGASTDGNIHLLTWGGWDEMTDVRAVVTSNGQPYEHCYTPTDYPENMGWTHGAVGAGATYTNIGPLNIISTGVNNSGWTDPGVAFWTSSAGDEKRVRFVCRVNSGGSVAVDSHRLELAMDDGVNTQEFVLRFSSTQFRILDGAGNVRHTETVDMTKWTEFLITFKHDNTPGAGSANVWFRQWHSSEFWTWAGGAAHNIAEIVGTTDGVKFGGTAAVAGNWDIAYLGVADDTNRFRAYAGSLNPTWLAPRPLTAALDWYLMDGIMLGAYNAGAVPDDAYDLATTYEYGKSNLWDEMRPSRQLRSTGDNVAWATVFDAGATDVFGADTVCLFGTNFRTATFQMNSADVWVGPPVSEALDATVATGTVGAGNRGPGYFGPAASPSWRPHQYRSDGDAHRWFVEVNGVSYEITDNSEDRIYVEGTDFSAASGTFYVYGDRMGKTFTAADYRYVRILVGAQQTADDDYRIGTPIFARRFTPSRVYDWNFVDRIEPTVTVHETDAGYRSASRKGPRTWSLSIQWAPIDAIGSDLERRIRDFYAALEGSLHPIAFWRDSTDQETLHLVTFEGAYSASNEVGELDDALARIDQLQLREWH